MLNSWFGASQLYCVIIESKLLPFCHMVECVSSCPITEGQSLDTDLERQVQVCELDGT